MRKLVGFVFGLFGKLLLLTLVVLFSGVLYVGAYFYQKSGEPMTVAEAQQRAPGLTFRDFWASRVEQWRYWDDEMSKAGKNGGACEGVATIFTGYRALITVPFVFKTRIDGPENYDTVQKINNNSLPSTELLYDGSLLDAAWASFEGVTWWNYANHPGSPNKALNQRRVCSTQYPTPAAYQPIRWKPTLLHSGLPGVLAAWLGEKTKNSKRHCQGKVEMSLQMAIASKLRFVNRRIAMASKALKAIEKHF